MDTNEWMEFRAESITYVDNLHESALKKYVQEAGFKDVFAYTYDFSKNKFTIYTRKPGVWIGLGGSGVKRLKEILSTDVRENCDVEFKEIRGRFIVCE